MVGLRRIRSGLAALLLTATMGMLVGPCVAMALAGGPEACPMPHADRGHCAPDVAMSPPCCHPGATPTPDAPRHATPSSLPHSVALAWSGVPGPAALPPTELRAAPAHALVHGSPPLFLQHRVLLI